MKPARYPSTRYPPTHYLLLTITSLLLSTGLSAQFEFSKTPDNAHFVTDDVVRFWQAYERMDDMGVAAFEHYVDQGTLGLHGFMQNRIVSADSLYTMVRRRPDDYLASRHVLDDLGSKREQILGIYRELERIYPDAVYPPVYFVVGRFNSGGTVSKDGLLIGTEKLEDLEGLPGLVAHELIHFQQRSFRNPTLLQQSIHEGSADFIGELISGLNVNRPIYGYGEQHREALYAEFKARMHERDMRDWLYGTTGKDDRPNDLGYWIGYEIAKAYYDKAGDKEKAVQRIIRLRKKEMDEFLAESGVFEE